MSEGPASFELTAADMVSAERLCFWTHYRSRKGLGELATHFLVFFLIGVFPAYPYWRWDRMTDILVTAAVLALLAVGVPLVLRVGLRGRRARKDFARQTSLHGAITIRWDEEAIDVSYPWGACRHRWSEFVRWAEDSSSLLLWKATGPASYHVIPKRVLALDDVAGIHAALAKHHIMENRAIA